MRKFPLILRRFMKIDAQPGLNETPDKFFEAVGGKLKSDRAIGEPAPLSPRKEI